MESEPKRIKLEEQSSPSPTANKMQFLDLNDDCIFEIFDRLSTINWCSMSLTCERLQLLALEHFQRKFPDEIISIQSEKFNDKISYDFSGLYRHPPKLISNVKMVNVPPLKSLFEFIKAECCPKLKTLSITTHSIISTTNGARIKSQLEGLESLSIFNLNPKTDIYNGFLKYCPKLEHLTIETTKDWKTNWMVHRYPELKSLSFFVDCAKPYRGKFGELAGQFFRNNPQLKDISCIGSWSMNQILLNKVGKIESLSIEIKTNDNLAEIFDNLKNYCQRGRIDFLEFDIINLKSAADALKMLNDLNVIHPIHGLSVAFNYDKNQVLSKEVMLNIAGLTQLRELDICISGRVNSCAFFDYFAKLLAKKMVHLEELKLPVSPFVQKDIVLESYIAPFVCNAKKMKKLTLDRYFPWKYYDQSDFSHLNANRLSLTGACSMDVHVGTTGYSQKFKIPSITKVAKCCPK